MSIVYLTWGETPRSYGVFGNQVIGQFKKISDNFKEHKLYFISGLPIIHSGLIREKLNYLKELKIIREELNPVKFNLIPIIATQNFINSNAITFRIFQNYFSHFFLYKKLKNINAQLVHCRSYHAAWAALQVRKKYKLNYKIIFDGRDLWPEEVALKKCWKESSKGYKYLKYIEKILILESDASISVSDKMHEYYKEIGAKNDKRIFLSADIDKFSREYKHNESITEKKLIIKFCYVGALSEGGWHKPSLLAELYSRLKEIYPLCKLTIITTSEKKTIIPFFNKFHINDVEYKKTKTIEELNSILSTQDIGIMSYYIPKEKMHLQLAKILLAIKTVEYLAAGLPVICNQFCGVATLLKENNIGISYNPMNLQILNEEDILPLLNKNIKNNCRFYASENFDINKNAKKYSQIYRELINV